MADNKAVNQTAAKPEGAKADKKAKANDGKKKVPFTAKVKNFFGRITKYFRDTKSELKKVIGMLCIPIPAMKTKSQRI